MSKIGTEPESPRWMVAAAFAIWLAIIVYAALAFVGVIGSPHG